MSTELILVCDAVPTDGGFAPTVKICEGAKIVLAWQGSFSLPSLSVALVYAHDYGNVALAALVSRQIRRAGDDFPP